MAWTIPSKILIECMVRALNYFVSMHHPHFVISPNQTDWLSEIYTVCFGWVFSTVERIISWNHNPGWIARRCCWAWKLRPRCSQCWPSMGPGELATDTKGHGLRTNNDKFDPHQRFPSLTCCVRYLTLCNGGIALAQAHIASLIIVVSQWVALSFLSLLYLMSTKYGQTLSGERD